MGKSRSSGCVLIVMCAYLHVLIVMCAYLHVRCLLIVICVYCDVCFMSDKH